MDLNFSEQNSLKMDINKITQPNQECVDENAQAHGLQLYIPEMQTVKNKKPLLPLPEGGVCGATRRVGRGGIFDS